MKLARKMQLALGSAALAMLVIGVIGMERTFVSYGRIDAPIFAIYALVSLFFMSLSIGIAIQAVKIEKVVVMRKPPKPKGPESVITTQDGVKSNCWIPPSKMSFPGKLTPMGISYEIKEKPNGSNGTGSYEGSGKDD